MYFHFTNIGICQENMIIFITGFKLKTKISNEHINISIAMDDEEY